MTFKVRAVLRSVSTNIAEMYQNYNGYDLIYSWDIICRSGRK